MFLFPQLQSSLCLTMWQNVSFFQGFCSLRSPEPRAQGHNMCFWVLAHCQYFSAALQGTPLSATLSLLMSQCCWKIKGTVQKLASDHKDIHSSVSRVGKAIDRVSMWLPGLGAGLPGAGVDRGSPGKQA